MKVASWNVNSLRVRLDHVLKWLETTKPDILVLQETKMTDDQFPEKAIREAGYHVVYNGQKTYNGVAILSKIVPQEVLFDIPGLEDPQRRIAAALIGDIQILDLYVVNGSEVGTEKFAYKLDWLEKVTHWVAKKREEQQKFIILGDFKGLRIDLILSSDIMAKQCTDCYIDKAPRTWERPSDHAPIVAEYRNKIKQLSYLHFFLYMKT